MTLFTVSDWALESNSGHGTNAPFYYQQKSWKDEIEDKSNNQEMKLEGRVVEGINTNRNECLGTAFYSRFQKPLAELDMNN